MLLLLLRRYLIRSVQPSLIATVRDVAQLLEGAGWLLAAGCLALAGWLAGWLTGWLVGWLAGWLARKSTVQLQLKAILGCRHTAPTEGDILGSGPDPASSITFAGFRIQEISI